jgi:hypothetical protein
MRWALELRKPTSELTAEQILALFLGGGDGDAGAGELIGKLLGGGSGSPGKGGPTSGLPGGVAGGVLQGQVKAFAEELKRGVRQVTLRITWKDGKTENGFDVSTYWVVLNPKAPGGSRGENPDVPSSMAPPPKAGAQPAMPFTPVGGQPAQGGKAGQK